MKLVKDDLLKILKFIEDNKCSQCENCNKFHCMNYIDKKVINKYLKSYNNLKNRDIQRIQKTFQYWDWYIDSEEQTDEQLYNFCNMLNNIKEFHNR
ncbi:MAG: hypothetical protein ACI4N3_02820 [Alphaproteobacteria bacterium]